MKASHYLGLPARAACVVLLLVGAVPVLAGAVNINVSQTAADRVTIHYALGASTMQTVVIDGQTYAQVALPGEARLMLAGAPELPLVARSIIIPDAGNPTIRILRAQYEDLPGVDVAPSKGALLRTQNPDDVPYTFGPAYGQDAFYPADVVALGEPYILRDYRGTVVAVNPCQYNPATRTLRVYTEIAVEVVTQGAGGINPLDRSTRSGKIDPAFHQIYAHQFINHTQAGLRYNPLDESGDMLIICHDPWISNVQPLVNHKIAKGINTTIVGVGTIGNNATAIKNYIQGVYNSSDLAFVLLVGDAAQVATPTASGGSSDPTYSKLAGGDNYPDIIVGRFSAETSAQVDTQVQRTVEYESLPAVLQPWFWKGTGIASAQGAGQGDEGQADYVHMDEIRQWLLNYGYTVVDQIYDTNGGTAAMVTAALNEGRGIVNYCGHGSTTSWGTTGFSNSNVNALVNDNMLPFIISVACVNGQFNGYTCFAEAWLRATHNGEPTGAIGTYMSSVNQSWAPPMEGQDEFNILLTELEANNYFSYGAMCFAGSCSMMDAYGSGGVDMFNTWHIFGDPSLCIRLVQAFPPTADDGTANVNENAPTNIALLAADEGLPNPPGALTYIINNLPGHGTLKDPGTGEVITSVPYPLVNGGKIVVYTPTLHYIGADSFEFKANDGGTPPDGGDSNIAMVTITVIGVPEVVYSFALDTNPGWSTTGAWAFGHPTGAGTHLKDPSNGHTGTNVYGYNLSGDYTNNLTPKYLTTTALNCSNYTQVQLQFWRWLGVEVTDHAGIEISTNGTTWTPVWSNTTAVSEGAWSYQTYNLAAVADHQPTVYLRWVLGPTDVSVTYPGWNIDDIQIWALVPPSNPSLGDMNCDGVVDFGDINPFVLALTNPIEYGVMYPSCDIMHGDINDDGNVDFGDINLFVQLLTGK